MKHRLALIFGISALSASFSAQASADTVRLKSGKAYTGKIYRETGEEISLVADTPAGITVIPVSRADVVSIETDDSQNQLLLTFTRFVTAYGEGDRHFEGGSYYKAIDFYKQAIELNPRVYAGYYNLGMAYAKLGLFNEARANLNKAIELARSVNQDGQKEREFIVRAQERLAAWGD